MRSLCGQHVHAEMGAAVEEPSSSSRAVGVRLLARHCRVLASSHRAGRAEASPRAGAETENRGRAKHAHTLAKATYAKSVQLEAARVRKAAEAAVLGSQNTARSFATTALRQRVGLARAKQQGGGRGRCSRSRSSINQNSVMRKVSGLDIFRSDHFHQHAAEGTLGEQQRALARAWRDLPQEQKAVFNARAETDTRSKRQAAAVRTAAGGGLRQFADGSGANLRRAQRGTARRVAILSSFRQLDGHSVWTSGTGLHCYKTPLRPDVALTNANAAIHAQCDDHFRFDPRVAVNPPGEMRTARLCSSAFGGVCKQDGIFDKCSTGFINIYRAFQSKHLQTPKELPLFVTVRVGAESEDLIACKFYGRGERAFFVDAVKHCDGGEEWVSLKELDGQCVITNGHQLLRRLLARVDRGDDEVDLTCFALAFRPVASEGFEARIGDEQRSSVLSLSVVKRASHKRKLMPKDCVELPFGIDVFPRRQRSRRSAAARARAIVSRVG